METMAFELAFWKCSALGAGLHRPTFHEVFHCLQEKHRQHILRRVGHFGDLHAKCARVLDNKNKEVHASAKVKSLRGMQKNNNGIIEIEVHEA